jgi:hypothetical protein
VTDGEQDISSTVDKCWLVELGAELCLDELGNQDSEFPDLDAELRWEVGELWEGCAVIVLRDWEREGGELRWGCLCLLILAGW